MNYLHLYKKVVAEVLKTIYIDGREVDPLETNRLVFSIRAYFVAYRYVAFRVRHLIGHKMTLDFCMEWIMLNFSADCPFLYIYKSTTKQVNDIINHYLIQLDEESLSYNVGDFYESLMHTDIRETVIVEGDKSRNKQGSYYSPQILATNLTKSVMDNYVKNNGLESLFTARFIDFSCGSGIFLTEAISYAKQLLKLTTEGCKALISNIYACDVDFIALEICKFNIIDLVCDDNAYCQLSSHFKHGNFLLSTDHESNAEAKIEAYLQGFLYHTDLSIDVDFLTEYDIILGNPPWEKIRFEEKSFYEQYVASIGDVNFKFDLYLAIDEAENTNHKLKEYVIICRNQIESAKKAIKESIRFKSSSSGELNTSNLFTEAAYHLMSKNTVIGLIVKSSTVATKASQHLFDSIFNNVVSISDFINKKKYFNIDGRERFALLIMDGHEHRYFQLAMNIQDVNDIKGNRVKVTKKDLSLLNPTTGMIPNLSSSKDLEILVSLYNQFKIVSDEFPTLKYGRLVHFTNHVKDIDREKKSDNLPVYEGKFFSSFDGIYAGFNHVPEADRYKAKAYAQKLSDADKQSHCYPESRFYIKKSKWKALSATYQDNYMLAWHSLTSATNERACVATILPFIPASQSVQFLTTDSTDELVYLCCLFNSVVFDYIVKNKLTGIDLTQSFIKQIAVPSINSAKQCIVCYNENTISVYSLLYSICREILKEDERLEGLWSQRIKPICGLPSDRKSLLTLMDILITVIYQIPSIYIKYIFSSYSNYSASEIEYMMEQVRQLSIG